MNQEKAKEFYSAYLEGSLDAGLRQSFEQKLSTDTALRADYDAFVSAVTSLDWLKAETIEVPSYLSDRIATRIEEARNLKQKRGIFGWLTPGRWALVGLATVAIVGVCLSIVNQEGRGTSMASFFGMVPAVTVPNAKLIEDGTQVSIVPSSTQAGSVTFDAKTILLKSKIVQPLKNSQSVPDVFTIQISGEREITYVIVPGTQRQPSRKGSGTMLEFAKALSGVYSVPVQVRMSDVSKTVTWNFNGEDPRVAATQALDPNLVAVDLQTSGGVGLIRSSYLISILDH